MSGAREKSGYSEFMRSSIQRFAPLVATLAVLAVNASANLVPLGGLNTGQLSALYPTGFTPAGWAFSIWSLIYLGLLAYSFAAAFGAERMRARIRPTLGWYYVSAAANAGWIFVWHYRMVAFSVALMLLILTSLIAITNHLRNAPRPTLGELACVDAPMSLYFGWITAATLVNIATLFYSWQWYPFGLDTEQWALVSVVTAAAIYVWMCATTRDLVYSAVLLWVALAIAYRPTGISETVRLAALAAAYAIGAALAAAVVSRFFRASAPTQR
jgi:translocator protein